MIRASLFALPLAAALTACGSSVPPIQGSISDTARAQSFPVLVPLDPLLAQAEIPSRAEPAGEALRARGAALSNAAIRRPSNGSLAERGRRLRERAAALRAASI